MEGDFRKKEEIVSEEENVTTKVKWSVRTLSTKIVEKNVSTREKS